MSTQFDTIGIRITHRDLIGRIKSEVSRSFEHKDASELLKVYQMDHDCKGDICTRELFRIVGNENYSTEYSLNVEDIEQLVEYNEHKYMDYKAPVRYSLDSRTN